MGSCSSSFSIGLSKCDKIAMEVAGEIANTLGLYGRIVKICVNEQKRLIDEIKEVVELDENNEICELKDGEYAYVAKLIDEYNENHNVAKKYQHYLNIQKEALGFRGFNYDPYSIMRKIKKK